ncbi:MAG: DUF3298 domain-containing protein [Deltaproteobacteria bacterium]|nr:DUF3298 domain-containing protein [Deltaproteobacteria bacterium]
MRWSVTPEGLRSTFDLYQVAPYAVGPQEMVIPYAVLAPHVRPDGPLAASHH